MTPHVPPTERTYGFNQWTIEQIEESWTLLGSLPHDLCAHIRELQTEVARLLEVWKADSDQMVQQFSSLNDLIIHERTRAERAEAERDENQRVFHVWRRRAEEAEAALAQVEQQRDMAQAQRDDLQDEAGASREWQTRALRAEAALQFEKEIVGSLSHETESLRQQQAIDAAAYENANNRCIELLEQVESLRQDAERWQWIKRAAVKYDCVAIERPSPEALGDRGLWEVILGDPLDGPMDHFSEKAADAALDAARSSDSSVKDG